MTEPIETPITTPIETPASTRTSSGEAGPHPRRLPRSCGLGAAAVLVVLICPGLRQTSATPVPVTVGLVRVTTQTPLPVAGRSHPTVAQPAQDPAIPEPVIPAPPPVPDPGLAVPQTAPVVQQPAPVSEPAAQPVPIVQPAQPDTLEQPRLTQPVQVPEPVGPPQADPVPADQPQLATPQPAGIPARVPAPPLPPELSNPALSDTGLTNPGLTNPGQTAPGFSSPGMPVPVPPGPDVESVPLAPIGQLPTPLPGPAPWTSTSDPTQLPLTTSGCPSDTAPGELFPPSVWSVCPGLQPPGWAYSPFFATHEHFDGRPWGLWPTASQVAVPWVVGYRFDSAQQTLALTGLNVGSVTEQHSASPPGTVLRTDPPFGNAVEPGHAVNLVIAGR